MKKVTVIIGVSSDYDQTNAIELLGRTKLKKTIIDFSKYPKKENISDFFFSKCEHDTRLVVIAKLNNIDFLESIICGVQFGIYVDKQSVKPFMIDAEIVIFCEGITKNEIEKLGNSLRRRIELIEIEDVPKVKCNCIEEVRKDLIEKNKANYVRIDMSTISVTEEGKTIKENLTGQRIEVGYNHIRRDGGIQRKERKSFISHVFCPFCGVKY